MYWLYAFTRVFSLFTRSSGVPTREDNHLDCKTKFSAMASRPCPSCGGHGIQCKCGGVGAQKRKSANQPSQTPAPKRAATSSAATSGAATKSSATKSSAAAAPKRTKAFDVQRLVTFCEVLNSFRGNRLPCLKKFDAPDGSCAVLHLASVSGEDVKTLTRMYRCNVFRVKHTGRACTDYKEMPYTVECADETTPYCYEGYSSTTLYVDGMRPYCFGCGGESRAYRKRAGAQTYHCAACNMEFTKKACANVFARLGPLKAMAEELNMTYKQHLNYLIKRKKVRLKYAPSAASAAAAPAAAAAAPAAGASSAAAPAAAAPAAAAVSDWEWSRKDLPGSSRADPNIVAQGRLAPLFNSITCRDGRKCCFEFKDARNRLMVQKAHLEKLQIDCGKPTILFHGCPFKVLRNILMGGFQNAGTKNAKVYGEGVYFAKHAEYSLHRQYSQCDEDGNRVLLLCASIVGKVHETTAGVTMLPLDCRTGGNIAKGIYMKPFANLADVVIAYAIVWQEDTKK